MKSLKEKATFFAVSDDAASYVEAMARDAFMPYMRQEGMVQGEASILVTVWQTQQERTAFGHFVNNAAVQLGLISGEPTTLVEVNGSLGIYSKGEDYE